MARYQIETDAFVFDAVHCSVVAMHATPAVKKCLSLASTNVIVSYAALERFSLAICSLWSFVR